MGNRRTVILIAAVVVAVVAAVAIYSYLNNVQNRAYHNAKLVKVFRVAKDIKKGLPGEQAVDGSFVKSDDIPQKFRPTTALTDLSAGQVVVDGMFVEPRIATVSFAQRIPAGQVAITMSFDNVHGVAGLIVPGDKVNMLAKAPDGERFLFQNVNVLAIGSTPALQPGETTATTAAPAVLNGPITFAVPPLAAEKLALVTDVYLTLVPPDNQPTPVPPANTGNLFTGPPTPYG